MAKASKKDQTAELEKAWSKFNKRDFEGALVIFEEMLQMHGASEALYGRACALFRSEEYEDALKDFNTLIKDDPGNTRYLHTRAMLFGAEEKTREAIKDLERVIELAPESVEALIDLGGAYLLQKEYVKASDCFERCIDLDRSCPDTWLGKGLVALEKKEWKRAIEFLNAAIKLDAKNLMALLARAEAYFSANQKQEAQKDIRKINTIDPDLLKSGSGDEEDEKEQDFDEDDDVDDDVDDDTDFESYKLDE